MFGNLVNYQYGRAVNSFFIARIYREFLLTLEKSLLIERYNVGVLKC
jgi:hypothetical protein